MNDSLIRLIYLSHAGSSIFMAGVIWVVQVVHYPLFSSVGLLEFPFYEQCHTASIAWVVAPPMLIEGASALLLLRFRPAEVPLWSLWIGLALLGVIWLSTALIQVPCHEVLSRGFNPVFHERLVVTNWLRTTSWSLRAALVLRMLWRSLCGDSPLSKT